MTAPPTISTRSHPRLEVAAQVISELGEAIVRLGQLTLVGSTGELVQNTWTSESRDKRIRDGMCPWVGTPCRASLCSDAMCQIDTNATHIGRIGWTNDLSVFSALTRASF